MLKSYWSEDMTLKEKLQKMADENGAQLSAHADKIIAIKERSYGKDPYEVSRFASIFIEEHNKKIKELEIKILEKFCDIAENAIAITNINSDMIDNMQERVDLIDQKHELDFDCIKGIARIL